MEALKLFASEFLTVVAWRVISISGVDSLNFMNFLLLEFEELYLTHKTKRFHNIHILEIKHVITEHLMCDIHTNEMIINIRHVYPFTACEYFLKLQHQALFKIYNSKCKEIWLTIYQLSTLIAKFVLCFQDSMSSSTSMGSGEEDSSVVSVPPSVLTNGGSSIALPNSKPESTGEDSLLPKGQTSSIPILLSLKF